MKLVVDMNLSPRWIATLQAAGHDARHWSQIGDARASDATIMEWARANGCAVLTHDLDFTTILALTRAVGPSVIQIRAQDVLPEALGPLIVQLLSDHAEALARGAVMSVDQGSARLRILPIS